MGIREVAGSLGASPTLLSDALASLVVGVFVGFTADAWTDGLWVGVLFFAVATASRLFRARRAARANAQHGPTTPGSPDLPR